MVSCELNSHWRQLYLLLKLFKDFDANFVQKCQICVIYENLDSIFSRYAILSDLTDLEMDFHSLLLQMSII